uniref:Multidrug resistance protein 1 n=1 Tax=Lygus hesperus TaxID=30085 RepID=A0A0A9X389_LYGHE
MLIEQIVRQDQFFFDLPGRDPGSLTAILAADCEAVHQLYGPALGSRLKALVSLLGGLAIGLLVQWKVALVAFSTMPFLFCGSMMQQVVFVDSPQLQNKSKLDVIINESFSAIRTIHNFNMNSRVIAQFASHLNNDQLTI